MNIPIPKRLQEAKDGLETIEKDTLGQEIAVINSELVTLSASLKPYLEAQRRLEKRIEHLVRRKHRLQRILVGVTKLPPKVGPYSTPTSHPTPSRESFIKKLGSLSKRQLGELGLRLDALGAGTGR